MFFSNSVAYPLKKRLSCTASLVKCAWDLLSERLADLNADSSSIPTSSSIIAQSIIQHGHFQAAVLASAIESLACLVLIYLHGFRGTPNRVFPIAKLRFLVILESLYHYLIRRAISISHPFRNNAFRTSILICASPYMVMLEVTNGVLREVFGDDCISLTWTHIWHLLEEQGSVYLRNLDNMITTIFTKSQHSLIVWVVYTSAFMIFLVNLCSTAIVVAFVYVYVCGGYPDHDLVRKPYGQTPCSETEKCTTKPFAIMCSPLPESSAACITKAGIPENHIATYDDNIAILCSDLFEYQDVEKSETHLKILEKFTAVDEKLQQEQNSDAIKIKITNCSGVDEVPPSPNEYHKNKVDNLLSQYTTSSTTTKSKNASKHDNDNESAYDTSSESDTSIFLSPEENIGNVFELDFNTPHDMSIVAEKLRRKAIDDNNASHMGNLLHQDRDEYALKGKEVKSSARRKAHFLGKENNPLEFDLTIRPKDKGKQKCKTDSEGSSPIDVQELLLERLDQVLAPTSKTQIGGHTHFSVHRDADVPSARRAIPFQSPPTEMSTGTKEQHDMFSVLVDCQEEKYTNWMPPLHSKLYETYRTSNADVHINQNDELQLAHHQHVDAANFNIPTAPLTPYSPVFVPQHMKAPKLEVRAQALPIHWNPARGGAIPIVAPTNCRRSRLGALASGDKRQDYMTRRTLA